MSFIDAVSSALRQYATFSGRARRAEYWWFVLFSLLVSLVAGVVDRALGTGGDADSVGIVGLVTSLALLLPGLAVAVRRLHDTEKSGWWVLAFLIPLVGFVLWLMFMLAQSDPYTNRYGPSPKPGALGPDRASYPQKQTRRRSDDWGSHRDPTDAFGHSGFDS